MSVFWTPGYAAAATYPMTHSRILHTPLAGTITASAELEGFEAVRAAKPDTYTFWLPPAAPASWEIAFGAPQLIDCAGIGAHALAGQAVALDTWDGTDWVEQIAVTPANGGAIMLLFAPVTTEKARLRFDGVLGAIGVIYVGKALEMQRAAFRELGQIHLQRRTEFKSNVSESGQWLGRSIARVGLRATYGWSHLTSAWWAANMEPFSLAARERPFFLAARPDGYPDEVAYGWVEADIRPERMGVKDMNSVTIDVSGYSRT